MIRSLDDLKGYHFEAKDGELGRVRDFYFDDQNWTVRYLVLETGKWLPGRNVLIAPQAIDSTDRKERRIHLDLSYDQVKKSPPLATDLPVSRQHEQELHDHYSWSPYWFAGPSALEVAMPIPASARKTQTEGREKVDHDPHLRSVDDVCGYGVEATDGSIGEVRDFACDEDDWTVRYLLIDTRKWLPGRPVLVAPEWVRAIDWRKRQLTVDLTRDQLESSPLIDTDRPIGRDDEEKLYAAQDRPRYWRQEKKSEA